MAKRRRSEVERRELLRREAELTVLSKHPSWDVLRAVVEEEEVLVRSRVANLALAGNGIPLEAQAYERGYVRGLYRTLAIPELAEGAQERRVKREEAANV